MTAYTLYAVLYCTLFIFDSFAKNGIGTCLEIRLLASEIIYHNVV